jgi:flagellar biosynthesis protein FlhF
MRVRIFTADTVAEAMRQIRRELGDEAVIISTQSDEDSGGVRITAALEQKGAEDALDRLLATGTAEQVRRDILHALDYHGVPRGLAESLLDEVDEALLDAAAAGLEAGLRRSFDFDSLTLAGLERPLMLVGVPGAGKTVAAAKLATRAVFEKRAVAVVSADGFRAGARAQLAAFTDILETELIAAEGPAELRAALERVPADTVAIVDTSGTNPFSVTEMAALVRLIEASRAEPVLVVAAGGDVVEAAEIAASFGTIGARRMVATRLDIARRLGAMLVTAKAGPLALSGISFSPQVARGLKPLSPQSLARLLMRDPTRAVAGTPPEKAVAQ